MDNLGTDDRGNEINLFYRRKYYSRPFDQVGNQGVKTRDGLSLR